MSYATSTAAGSKTVRQDTSSVAATSADVVSSEVAGSDGWRFLRDLP
ncbi:hypothetical protein [Mycobacterium alsense]|nr:hypothetical protein [Mycobacterium alsense]